jgi:hypothetical protein
MKIVLILFLLPILSFANPLLNDREAESSFYNTNKVFKIKENMKPEYQSILKYFSGLEGRVCLIDLYETSRSFFSSNKPRKSSLKNAFIFARYNNAIDDVVLRNLLHINKKYKEFKTKTPKETKKELTKEQHAAYKRNSKLFPTGKGPCLSDRWNLIYKGLKKSYPKKKRVSSAKLKKFNKLALLSEVIEPELFNDLEKARQLEFHKLDLTISNYIKKKKSLRAQFNVDPLDLSEITTKKSYRDKKKTLRMQLYDNFDFMQISLMSSLISNMRKRLDSANVQINVNYYPVDGKPIPSEIIELEPMEKYRFILKIFQKELNKLNEMSFFDGRKATFLDVLLAGFETGQVPAMEMTELEKLDDIWNPQKTRGEKIMFWVRSFGSVGAILLPPPYGFVAVLAISIIEASVQASKNKKQQNKDKDYSLF